jgi:hypothetical protein
MSAEGPAPRDSFRICLLASALLGGAIGLCFPTAHVAIEPAQVLAGVVAYPPENPFGLYQQRVWTLWHPLLALPLAAGVSERALAFAMSGVVGALGFAAIAAFAWACGAPLLLAIASPLVLWLLDPIRWGFNYPILLLGAPHTYGMAGLAWALLAISMLGAGRVRLGAFLLGMAPAIHPSLGFWVGAVTALCLLLDARWTRAQLPELAVGGAFGVAVAAISLAVHAAGQMPGPPVDPAEVSRHMVAYMRDWDGHRGAVWLVSWNGFLLAIGVLLALQRSVRTARPAAVLLLRVYAMCALLGVAFALLRNAVPASAMPSVLVAAMPARVLNLPMLAFVPLVVATLGVRRDSAFARAALVALGALSLLHYARPWLVEWGVPAIGLVAVVLSARYPAPADGAGRAPAAVRWIEGAVWIGLALALVVAIGASARGAPKRAARLYDRSNEPVLAAASQGTGTLVVAPGLTRIQFATRRPLLLDPNAIDMLPYAPDGSPAVARIVDAVYGVDFFKPPHRSRNLTVVDPDLTWRTWTRRSSEQWRALADRFGFRDVLAPPDWQLDLPIVARSDLAVLYRVGGVEEPEGE